MATPHPVLTHHLPPRGKAWFVRAQSTDRHAPSVSRRIRALQTSLPCAKGGVMRSMPEGLLQSKGTTPQSTSSGCFSVSLAKSSACSRRRKTPRDAFASRTAHPLHRGAENTRLLCRDRRPRRPASATAQTDRRACLPPAARVRNLSKPSPVGEGVNGVDG